MLPQENLMSIYICMYCIYIKKMINFLPDHQADPLKSLLHNFVPTENDLIGEADASVENQVDLG